MTDGACLICECALTAAKDSEEHVIPNAIGGRWKMRGILCRSCNNTSGVTWDAALAAQLHWFGSAPLIGADSLAARAA